MKITKRKIERLIALSEACFEHLFSNERRHSHSPHFSPKMGSFGFEQVMDGMLDGVSALQTCQPFQELSAFLRALSDIERREVLALICVGYGSTSAPDFQSAFDSARVGRDREDELCFIAANLFSADDLAEGFEKLNRARVV
jgi:hypothetical protein